MNRAEFVSRLYQAALATGMTDAAARVTASQGAVESGYGKHAPGNNYFGIKAGKSWTGPTQSLWTHEVNSKGETVRVKQTFRAYDSPEAALSDRVKVMDRAFPGFSQAQTVGDAYNVLQNGKYGRYATAKRADYEGALNHVNMNYLGGTPVPPMNIPSAAPPLPRPRPSPPTVPQTTFGGRLPAQAMNGVDRLGVGKAVIPSPDMLPTGQPVDARTMSLAAPFRAPFVSEDHPLSNAVPKAPPLPIPRPAPPIAAPVPAAPLAAPVQPRSAPPPMPQAPVPLRPPTVTLASGKQIAVGTYNQGDHNVQVTDDGTGRAKVDIVRGPMAIPGVIDPLKEMNAPTLAGGFIRNKVPEVMAQGYSGLKDNLGSAVTGVQQTAANAVNGLGSNISGLGSTIGSAFGGIFNAKPPAPYLPANTPPTTTYDYKQMQVSNPAYEKYIATQGADDIGSGPGSFASLQSALPATKPSAPPSPYITKTVAVPYVPVPRAPAALPLTSFNAVNPASQIVPRAGSWFGTTPAGHVGQLLTGQPIQGGLLGMLFNGGGILGNLFGGRAPSAAPAAQAMPNSVGNGPVVGVQQGTTGYTIYNGDNGVPGNSGNWFNDVTGRG